MSTPIKLLRLTAADVPLLRELNALFAEAFADARSYADDPPSQTYLEGLLAKEHIIALVALSQGRVVGALVAYELDKLERKRREIYIYDLAVVAPYRRRGVATRLLHLLQQIARTRGAYIIFVQADYGDCPAIALYKKFGEREEVLHFDLPV